MLVDVMMILILIQTVIRSPAVGLLIDPSSLNFTLKEAQILTLQILQTNDRNRTPTLPNVEISTNHRIQTPVFHIHNQEGLSLCPHWMSK